MIGIGLRILACFAMYIISNPKPQIILDPEENDNIPEKIVVNWNIIYFIFEYKFTIQN